MHLTDLLSLQVFTQDLKGPFTGPALARGVIGLPIKVMVVG